MTDPARAPACAVFLFDVAKGVVAQKWTRHEAASLQVAWSPVPPHLLASSSRAGDISVYTAADRTPPQAGR
jgi:hypothetical protein